MGMLHWTNISAQFETPGSLHNHAYIGAVDLSCKMGFNIHNDSLTNSRVQTTFFFNREATEGGMHQRQLPLSII